jgi:hypothetical protein
METGSIACPDSTKLRSELRENTDWLTENNVDSRANPIKQCYSMRIENLESERRVEIQMIDVQQQGWHVV